MGMKLKRDTVSLGSAQSSMERGTVEAFPTECFFGMSFVLSPYNVRGLDVATKADWTNEGFELDASRDTRKIPTS